MTVSILPLTITTVFCYNQITTSLFRQEENALRETLNTAADSLHFQAELYENLLQYVCDSEAVISTSSREYATVYEKYHQFSYVFDVFLNSVMVQHPEVERITLYTDRDDIRHGKQLQLLSDLEAEPWFTEELSDLTAEPQWFVRDDGSVVLVACVPEPYLKYVKAYSDSCVSVIIPRQAFYYFLDNLSQCHLTITREGKTFYEYTDPDIAGTLSTTSLTSLSAEIEGEWLIQIERPAYLIFQSAAWLIVVMIGIIVVCFFLIFFLSRLFADFSARRIDALNRSMQIVQTGNFDIDLHDDCQDEIGVLTSNFRTMANEIQTLIQENYQKTITLKEAQFKALQAQINPHFLYNCLSLINSRALLTHQNDISQMSQLMSTFYRTTLNKGNSMTLLRDEIRNVMSYLEIQRLLHDNRFQVITQIDPILPEISVPNLLLQPLVENSIVHGLLPRQSGDGCLFLTIRRVDNAIHFNVMDNGVGIEPEKIASLTSTDSSGYGLKNVNERLLLTYGEESCLKIKSIQNESTMITFFIPFSDPPSSSKTEGPAAK
ncbi:MAG: sensor histidine kinase [Clostridiales bacterium]|nr:sensor histidine kinase [Clostridiales bacterium]